MKEETELTDQELVGRAISNAIKAYNETFEEEGIEAAYYPILKILAGRSNNNFDELLETMKWESKEYGLGREYHE